MEKLVLPMIPRPAAPALALALALAGASACTTAPAAPTWQTDVAPILASNCIRCHGAPAIGGAPPSFRLDIPDDTVDPVSGRTIRGAGTMAYYVAARTADGSMPPVFPLVGDDVDVLHNWAQLETAAITVPGAEVTAQPPPRGAARAGNHAPTLALTVPAGAADGAFAYEIDDADLDLVRGRVVLHGAGTVVADDLHAGRGTIAIDTAALPPGQYALDAILDDGAGEVTVPILGPVLAVTRTGDAPPRLAITRPRAGDLLLASTATIAMTGADLDAADPLIVSARAIDAVHPAANAIDLGMLPGDRRGATTFSWDLAAVPAGEYTLEATITDGKQSFVARTGRFRVQHPPAPGPTTPRFADVQSIFVTTCTTCHAGCASPVPRMVHDWSGYTSVGTCADRPGAGAATLTVDAVGDNLGAIYDRVVVRHDMPPPSAREKLSDADRAKLAAWLAAGAQP